jgi:putative hydrolase of the HAD superfamily
MAIKNIVFDVGNVLVRWDPHTIINQSFPNHVSPQSLMQAIFKHQTWYDLNLGLITEVEAIAQYHERLQIDKPSLELLIQIAKASLLPIEESILLLERLSRLEFKLYALTDNTKEIMIYLKEKYQFWQYFQGVVVSAEIGYLKPAQEIYQHLLTTYQLEPFETVFIDDLEKNIQGAKQCGIHGVVFQNTAQCIESLKALGVKV